MASPGARPRPSPTTTTFSRNLSPSPHSPGIKRAPNGAAFVSSGIPDLDRILGGGFLLGSVVLVAEDAEAPHHLLLLRNFMAQGVVHHQPVLFLSPVADPTAFLGTLPSPVSGGDGRTTDADQKGLRIAWQYKKYFGEQQGAGGLNQGNLQEYCNDFDLRKPLDRRSLVSNIECLSLLNSSDLKVAHERCSTFLNQFPRVDGGSIAKAGRIAIQSLCAPQCHYSDMDWDMLSFLRSLRAVVRSSNAVAVVTFPASILTDPVLKRWQHLADTLLAVRAIADEDKEMAKLLTGYQDMIGLLHVQKVAQINSQVPVILEASTFSLKLHKRRTLVLERLNQAPVDGSAGSSFETSGSCSGSLKASPIDF